MEGRALKFRLHIYGEEPPVAPFGYDFRDSIKQPLCRGFRWLTANRAEVAKLRALGGCQTR